MANYKLWNVRLRHVWLGTPVKSKRPKLRSRSRIGLQDAIERRAPAAEVAAEPAKEN